MTDAAAPRRNAEEAAFIAVMATCAALVFLNRSGIAYLFPAIKLQFHLSNTQLGQLMAATALTWAASSVVSSFASDALAIRPRTLIVICALGFSLVGAAAGAVTSFGGLLALRAAMGLFEGPVIPLIQATVSRVSPAQRRGANLGLIIGGSGLVGAVLAPALMTGLANTVGWRYAFLAIAIPGPLVALAVWFVTRARGLVGQAGAPERLDIGKALRLGLQRNVFLGAIGAVTLIGSAVASGSFMPLYLASLPAFGVTERVLLLIGLGIVSSVGAVVVPALSDRLGRKPCLIAACLCGVAAPVALAMMSVWPAVAIPAVLLHFGAAGALILMVYVIPGESVPPAMAASTYAVLLFVGEVVGGATAPAIAGWAADHHGLIAVQWVVCAFGLIALAAALFVKAPAARPHPAEEPLLDTWPERVI